MPKLKINNREYVIEPGADLHGADLHDAKLPGADLSNANLSDANLRGADLGGAKLIDANLMDADLSHASLFDADLRVADLFDANLSHADLSHADLRGADLRGADLSNANLSGTDLSNVKLSGAKLSGANLSGTDLDYLTDDMDKQDIVEGGIYAVDLPLYRRGEKSLFSRATVMKFSDREGYVLCLLDNSGQSMFVSMYLTLAQLGKQIGYDPTYSEDYKKAKSELERLESLKKSCVTIRNSLDERNINIDGFTSNLGEYWREIELEIMITNQRLDEIKARKTGGQT